MPLMLLLLLAGCVPAAVHQAREAEAAGDWAAAHDAWQRAVAARPGNEKWQQEAEEVRKKAARQDLHDAETAAAAGQWRIAADKLTSAANRADPGEVPEAWDAAARAAMALAGARLDAGEEKAAFALLDALAPGGNRSALDALIVQRIDNLSAQGRWSEALTLATEAANHPYATGAAARQGSVVESWVAASRKASDDAHRAHHDASAWLYAAEAVAVGGHEEDQRRKDALAASAFAAGPTVALRVEPGPMATALDAALGGRPAVHRGTRGDLAGDLRLGRTCETLRIGEGMGEHSYLGPPETMPNPDWQAADDVVKRDGADLRRIDGELATATTEVTTTRTAATNAAAARDAAAARLRAREAAWEAADRARAEAAAAVKEAQEAADRVSTYEQRIAADKAALQAARAAVDAVKTETAPAREQWQAMKASCDEAVVTDCQQAQAAADQARLADQAAKGALEQAEADLAAAITARDSAKAGLDTAALADARAHVQTTTAARDAAKASLDAVRASGAPARDAWAAKKATCEAIDLPACASAHDAAQAARQRIDAAQAEVDAAQQVLAADQAVPVSAADRALAADLPARKATLAAARGGTSDDAARLQTAKDDLAAATATADRAQQAFDAAVGRLSQLEADRSSAQRLHDADRASRDALPRTIVVRPTLVYRYPYVESERRCTTTLVGHTNEGFADPLVGVSGDRDRSWAAVPSVGLRANVARYARSDAERLAASDEQVARGTAAELDHWLQGRRDRAVLAANAASNPEDAAAAWVIAWGLDPKDPPPGFVDWLGRAHPGLRPRDLR